jgi:hypothetical protein
MALIACEEIKNEIEGGSSAEGILARHVKTMLSIYREGEPAMRDYLLEGFCDELQKFIEAGLAGGDIHALLKESRL